MSVDEALSELVRNVVRAELESVERDPWVAVSAVDELIGKRARRNAQSSGQLRTVRVGRRTLLRRTWLDQFLENHEVRLAPPTNPGDDDDDLVRLNLARNGYRAAE